ncbi:DUF6599 family protein [Magnetococcus marinus]|nr:DUF6599 family protein [Magnetococcus marinus]
MTPGRAPAPQPAKWLRGVLLGLLPTMALGIWWHGQRHVPERDASFMQRGAQLPERSMPSRVLTLGQLGSPRHYSAENLYEYINGHAEAFISAGFVALEVLEYAPEGADQPQLVVDIYRMGASLQAFGILQDEVGEQDQGVQVGDMGYSSGDQLQFIRGPYFVKLSRFSPTLELLPAATAMANALQGQGAALLFPFPALGQPQGIRYIRSDYHGLEFLQGVVEQTFMVADTPLKAFLIRQPQPQLAQTLAKMSRFYMDEAIVQTPLEYQGMPYSVVEDPYEGRWFYVAFYGHLWGVWGEPDAHHLDALHAVWQRLQRGEQP